MSTTWYYVSSENYNRGVFELVPFTRSQSAFICYYLYLYLSKKSSQKPRLPLLARVPTADRPTLNSYVSPPCSRAFARGISRLSWRVVRYPRADKTPSQSQSSSGHTQDARKKVPRKIKFKYRSPKAHCCHASFLEHLVD